MKNSMKKYDSYRDSGIEWLGEIPSHWEENRLGSILTPYSVKNMAHLPLLSITREKGVILRDNDNDENHNFIPDDLSGYKHLKIGQFGMNKMKAWQGSFGYSNYEGIVSPAYYIFDISTILFGDFFSKAIRSTTYVPFFVQASDGVRIGQWDLSKDRMKKIVFFIPPIKEQQAIATFLDDKCGQIDKAIEIKEKQIGLLKEQRQIIIHNAVTKGIDKNVKLRDSGVDWIGDIPEHWEVLKVKYIFNKINTGTTPSTSVTDYFDGTINWYNPRDLNNEYLNFSEKKVTFKAIEYKQVKFFEGDSILVVGIGATAGKTSYLTKTSTFNQQITGFKTYSHNN